MVDLVFRAEGTILLCSGPQYRTAVLYRLAEIISTTAQKEPGTKGRSLASAFVSEPATHRVAGG